MHKTIKTFSSSEGHFLHFWGHEKGLAEVSVIVVPLINSHVLLWLLSFLLHCLHAVPNSSQPCIIHKECKEKLSNFGAV